MARDTTLEEPDIVSLTPDHCFRGVVLTFVLAFGAGAGLAQEPDRVRLTDKTEILGEVVAVSPTDVEIRDARTAEPARVTIDRIAAVEFGGEPEGLRTARNLLRRQDAAGALDEVGAIAQVELDGASDNVLADVAFIKAAATARLATTSGTGLDSGALALRGFLAAHARSHQAFRAHELLGDLLVRAGTFDEAAAAYAALEQGPPALKVRAALAKAGALVAQKKYPEAEREYAAAAALPIAPDDRAAARQQREAQAGRARCLSRQGKAADAIDLVHGLLREADPDDREHLGRAYAVLGDAYRAADKDQDALIAFLTVDLVYNTAPETHAEALYNLVQLWQKVQNPERSRAARQALESAYPESRWTKALAAAAGKG